MAYIDPQLFPAGTKPENRGEVSRDSDNGLFRRQGGVYLASLCRSCHAGIHAERGDRRQKK